MNRATPKICPVCHKPGGLYLTVLHVDGTETVYHKPCYEKRKQKEKGTGPSIVNARHKDALKPCMVYSKKVYFSDCVVDSEIDYE